MKDIESSDKEPLKKIIRKCQKKDIPSDKDDTPVMELAKRIQEKDRVDKLGNDHTSVKDQRPVNEVSFLMDIQKCI